MQVKANGKQIVGKAIDEGAYVSQDQLRGVLEE